MATDECLGAQAQGRASVLIQNGDWCGIFPEPVENIAATAHSIRAQPRSLQKQEWEFVSLLTPAAKW